MSNDNTSKSQTVQRRRFIKAVGATGIAGGLAGCSGGDGGDGSGGDGSGGDGSDESTPTPTGTIDSSGGETVIQWAGHNHWANNQEQINNLLHEYGMPENIRVEANIFGQESDSKRALVQQWLSAGRKTPDVMIFDAAGWTQPFIARDQLPNLEEMLPQNLLDRVHNDYSEAMVTTATDASGNLRAFPFYPDFPTIQYRKDLVSDAGYDWEQYATDPMSWEQFSQEVKDVYEQSDVEYGFNTQHPASGQLSCCVLLEYVSSYGGAYFGNPQENQFKNIGSRPVTIDEQEVITSMQMARTLVHGNDAPHTLDNIAGGITPQAVSQWNVENARGPFTSGNAVALRNWPYSIAISGTEDNLGEDQGVMPMPYGVPESEGKYPGTGGSIGALGGWNLGINPNSEKVESIISVFRALQKPGFMKEVFGITGQMPPDPSVLSEATEVDIMGRHVDTLAYQAEHSVPRPGTPIWPQQSDAISQAANAALQSGGNPETEMADLADRLTAIENDYGG